MSSARPTSVCPEETAEICKKEKEVGGSWKEGRRSCGSVFSG